MNNYKNTSKKLIAMICGVCLLSALVLSSCLKQNSSQNINPPLALVSFVQASPDEPPLDFVLDNNRVNINPLDYGDNINYFQAYAGTRTANFINHGTTTKILTDTVNFNTNAVYSLFLANTPNKPEIVKLTDTIVRPPNGNTSIRFINLSPDAPAVDLAVTGGAVLVSNKAYKGHSSFIPIAGDKTYSLEVRQKGTNTVLATLSNVSLNNSYVYTIWFHGLAASDSDADKLGVSMITNAYY